MRQTHGDEQLTLALFEPATQPRQDPTAERGFYVLRTDGGISREPGRASGQAGIGVVLKDDRDRDVDTESRLFGWVRNHHEAEFRAFIAGLELSRRHAIDRIRVFADSRYVIHTVNGEWKLKAEHFKAVYARAILLVREFVDITLAWVPREQNVEADALAGRALGRGRRVPARTVCATPQAAPTSTVRARPRRAAWRYLSAAEMAAHLLAVPQICDRAWTSEPRLPGETRPAFIARVLLGADGPIQ